MLKNIKELGKDSLYYGMGSMLSQLIALFLVPYFSHSLTPQEYGLLAMAALLSQSLTPVLSLGLDNALFRYFSMSNSQKEQQGYVTTASFFKNSITVICIFILYFCHSIINDFLFDGNLSLILYLMVLGSIICSSIGSIAEVVIRTQRKPLVILAISLPNLVLGIFLSIYWVLWLQWGVYGALLASLVGQFYSALAYTIYIRKYINLLAFSKEALRTLLRYSLPLIPHRIQAQIMQLFSLFIVSQYMGLAVAGTYSVVSKFVKPLHLFVDSVQKAWVPYKFHIHKTETNPSEIFRMIISNYYLFILFVWGIYCLIFPWVFKELIDEKYFSGIPYFSFLSFIPLAQAFNYTFTTGIELANNQKINPIASFFGMLVVISFSILTVDNYSPYGPILAQILAILTMAFIVLKEARKIIKIDFPFVLLVVFLMLEISLILLSTCIETLLMMIICMSVLFAIALVSFNLINRTLVSGYKLNIFN